MEGDCTARVDVIFGFFQYIEAVQGFQFQAGVKSLFRRSVSSAEECDGNFFFVFFVEKNTSPAKSAAVAIEAHLFGGGYVCQLEVLAYDVLQVFES